MSRAARAALTGIGHPKLLIESPPTQGAIVFCIQIPWFRNDRQPREGVSRTLPGLVEPKRDVVNGENEVRNCWGDDDEGCASHCHSLTGLVIGGLMLAFRRLPISRRAAMPRRSSHRSHHQVVPIHRWKGRIVDCVQPLGRIVILAERQCQVRSRIASRRWFPILGAVHESRS